MKPRNGTVSLNAAKAARVNRRRIGWEQALEFKCTIEHIMIAEDSNGANNGAADKVVTVLEKGGRRVDKLATLALKAFENIQATIRQLAINNDAYGKDVCMDWTTPTDVNEYMHYYRIVIKYMNSLPLYEAVVTLGDITYNEDCFKTVMTTLLSAERFDDWFKKYYRSQDKFDIVRVTGEINDEGEMVEDSREVHKGLTPKGIATIIAVPELSVDAVSVRYEGFGEPIELTCCLDIMDMIDRVKELN